jgi:GTP-sensing pleiotropic transcriptional regulator CodY
LPSKLRAALSGGVRDFATKLQEAQKQHGKPFTFEEMINRLMEMMSLPNGEIIDTSPHLLAASVNPNILLGHAEEAMKAHDADKF